jgi:hypothetical protein
MQQHSDIPYEIFTIDNLFKTTEITTFKNYILTANNNPRLFSDQDFKNGKAIHPEYSKLFYDRIKSYLPKTYTDRQEISWQFQKCPKTIMFANFKPNQSFGIHTDTGCVYSDIKNNYSKYTVLTYLNSDFDGGYTKFYDNNFQETVNITPNENRTLIFDINLFHSGEKIISGNKYWLGTELVCSKVC